MNPNNQPDNDQPADSGSDSGPLEAQNQPVEELEPTLAGQLVPVPTVAVGAVPTQRLVGVRNFFRNKKAITGISIVLVLAALCFLAPVLAAGDPNEFVDAPNLSPSPQHLLGTEGAGKEVFRQLLWGGQNSLIIGFGTAFLTTLISTVIGMCAGYFRGKIDDVLTFLMNLFLVIPGLPLLIVLSGYLKPSTGTVILVLAITGWAFSARVMRAQTLSLREKDFVAAARVSGEGNFRVIFQEVLPNMINIIVGSLIGGVIYGIAASTGLSFLGLTNPADVTWGTMLYWAQQNNGMLLGAWWTFLPPGLCVALVAFGLSFINYAMDEVTNPRLRAEKELNNVLKGTTFRKGRVRATPIVRNAR